MADGWLGGTPRLSVFEGVDDRVLVKPHAGRMVAMTVEEARSLHRWLGRLLWARDSADRARRVDHA